MKELAHQISILLADSRKFINASDADVLAFKASENKWSKKEILGHLADSAMNNLQRFTEIQYSSKPYLVRKYQQDELVRANHYQSKNIQDTLALWEALNIHIIWVITSLSKEVLAYEVLISQVGKKTLKWLIQDYVEHMMHHLSQIKSD